MIVVTLSKRILLQERAQLVSIAKLYARKEGSYKVDRKKVSSLILQLNIESYTETSSISECQKALKYTLAHKYIFLQPLWETDMVSDAVYQLKAASKLDQATKKQIGPHSKQDLYASIAKCIIKCISCALSASAKLVLEIQQYSLAGPHVYANSLVKVYTRLLWIHQGTAQLPYLKKYLDIIISACKVTIDKQYYQQKNHHIESSMPIKPCSISQIYRSLKHLEIAEYVLTTLYTLGIPIPTQAKQGILSVYTSTKKAASLNELFNYLSILKGIQVHWNQIVLIEKTSHSKLVDSSLLKMLCNLSIYTKRLFYLSNVYRALTAYFEQMHAYLASERKNIQKTEESSTKTEHQQDNIQPTNAISLSSSQQIVHSARRTAIIKAIDKCARKCPTAPVNLFIDMFNNPSYKVNTIPVSCEYKLVFTLSLLCSLLAVFTLCNTLLTHPDNSTLSHPMMQVYSTATQVRLHCCSASIVICMLLQLVILEVSQLHTLYLGAYLLSLALSFLLCNLINTFIPQLIYDNLICKILSILVIVLSLFSTVLYSKKLALRRFSYYRNMAVIATFTSLLAIILLGFLTILCPYIALFN
ncbi:hypothetical protein NEOKW01_1096 [Nematocida sp. AWRm80]|nr:hypothetical protein NEOKW01_1096 [Nematocida sp. AWRm80]